MGKHSSLICRRVSDEEKSRNNTDARLHETADIGSNVLELFAVDGDFGENGRVTYSIVSGNVGNVFAVDEDLGMIKVARKLDLTVQVPEP
jgi:Cadherin domain